MLFRHRFPVIALLVMLFAALTGQHANARQLTIGISQFPSNFHPMIDSTLARTYVLGFGQRPITVYDADWELTCLLCTELPTIENGRAVLEERENGEMGMAITYTLPEEAKWGDGTRMTTEDVVFTWEVGRHPDSGVTNFEFFQNDILDITVVDDHTFTLHMDKVTCEFASISGFTILPAHLERGTFEGDPSAYQERTLYDTDTTNPGLYYGPYRITRVDQGSSVVLEPNEYWWGKKPAFERIIVRTVTNTAALSANLLSGGMDMIAGELGLALDEALAFEARAGNRFNFVYRPGLIYEHIDVNLDNPMLADKRVRQALLYGLDREQINQRLFDGRQPVAKSNVNPLDSVYYDGVRDYPFDPEQAAQLLEEAGWFPAAGDGIRRNQDGEALRVTLQTTAGNTTRELVQQVIQQQWKALGINVVIDNQPARVFFGETVRKRQFPALAMFAWISSPRSIPRTTLHSEMIPSPENNWAGQNSTGYRNAKMDELLEEMEDTCEPAANQALWNQVQEIYAEDLPALPLYFRANAYILPKWLTGLRPTGHQFPSTYWVEEWQAE
ncbi:MAG: peptide ABC transporter [Micavibrio sp. TMED2]|nr:MAG: peptide ABC transporter [Micavibrio sp. TMED2]|tara:strand:+ start:11860 stop:13533 length:1674 start_codon:yes stop_codon:yes gene_type:complete